MATLARRKSLAEIAQKEWEDYMNEEEEPPAPSNGMQTRGRGGPARGAVARGRLRGQGGTGGFGQSAFR